MYIDNDYSGDSIVVLLVATGSLFAVTNVGTGSLNVYGKIIDGDVTFSVNQTLLSANRIDLVDNDDIQPSGDGVEVGNWEFDSVNQGTAITYTLTYTYGALTEGTTDIEYKLLESNGTTSTPIDSGSTSTFNATTGNFNQTRTILVRLTAAGATEVASAPASSNYNSTIDLVLTAP